MKFTGHASVDMNVHYTHYEAKTLLCVINPCRRATLKGIRRCGLSWTIRSGMIRAFKSWPNRRLASNLVAWP
ncbi:MAG: hypothetical protein ABI217_10145, partial [Chthoniobacterales bacterium]